MLKPRPGLLAYPIQGEGLRSRQTSFRQSWATWGGMSTSLTYLATVCEAGTPYQTQPPYSLSLWRAKASCQVRATGWSSQTLLNCNVRLLPGRPPFPPRRWSSVRIKFQTSSDCRGTESTTLKSLQMPAGFSPRLRGSSKGAVGSTPDGSPRPHPAD